YAARRECVSLHRADSHAATFSGPGCAPESLQLLTNHPVQPGDCAAGASVLVVPGNAFADSGAECDMRCIVYYPMHPDMDASYNACVADCCTSDNPADTGTCCTQACSARCDRITDPADAQICKQ